MDEYSPEQLMDAAADLADMADLEDIDTLEDIEQEPAQ